jgi:hypothetical protein
LEDRGAALEFILRGHLLDCCLICYFSSTVARDAFSPLYEGSFYSLTTGFVDKLPEAEQAEEALGDEEGRVADRIWLFGDGDITKVHHSVKNPVS